MEILMRNDVAMVGKSSGVLRAGYHVLVVIYICIYLMPSQQNPDMIETCWR